MAPELPSAVLTVIGAGTLLPHPERGSACFHVQAMGDPSHSLLMDVGTGTLHGLPRAGVDWRTIDTVAVTHFHTDHIADLPPLLAAYRFRGLTRPLTLVGPRGLGHLLERMAALHGPWILEPSRPLTVVELDSGDGWSSHDGLVRLEARETRHTDESLAYRVEVGAGRTPRKGAWVGYTGDTGPSVTLPAFFAGCDVLVAECALTDPPDLDTHLSPQRVADLGRVAAPELLLLSHVYPPQSPEEAVEAVGRRYGGRVQAARDGTRVSIRPSGVTVDPPHGAP